MEFPDLEHKICIRYAPDKVLGALPSDFERKCGPPRLWMPFVHFCAGILLHPAVKYQVLPGEGLEWAEFVPSADPEAIKGKRTAGVFL